MKYALISDLHGNRQAVNSVLTDIAASGADCVLCLGDMVGYGPAPAAVLQQVYSKVDYFILGNHDAVVAGRINADSFNPEARRIIEWTQEQVDGKAREFLGGLPAVLEGDGFRCVHAELSMPLQFNYIFEPEDAYASWRVCNDQFIFVGHSHEPAIFLTGQSGRAYLLPPQDFKAEKGKRYIVNVGSVGQPRDGDYRASYCLFDSDNGDVYFRRVAFDLDSYRDEALRSRVPGGTSYFLRVAESCARKPLREVVDFTPLSKDAAERQGDAVVASLLQAESRVRLWRTIGLIFALAAVLVCALFFIAYYQMRPDHIVIDGTRVTDINRLERGIGDVLLPVAPPDLGAVSPAAPLAGWRIVLPRSGQVTIKASRFDDGERLEVPMGFTINSTKPEPFEIRSPEFAATAGLRLAVVGSFRTRRWESGVVDLALVLVDEMGVEKTLLIKEPAGLENIREQWPRRTSGTMDKGDLIPHDGNVYLVIRGQFNGEIDIADCHVVVKEN